MALFSQNMLELAIELATHDPVYEEMVFKFIEHFYYIAAGINRSGWDGMWDDEDGFYYDVLRLPDGSATRLKVRSVVGLLPLCAVTVFDGLVLKQFPAIVPRIRRFLDARPELTAFIQDPAARGEHGRLLASILDAGKLR